MVILLKKNIPWPEMLFLVWCVSMTDYRTFRGDYQKLVDFVRWYNEFS